MLKLVGVLFVEYKKFSLYRLIKGREGDNLFEVKNDRIVFGFNFGLYCLVELLGDLYERFVKSCLF